MGPCFISPVLDGGVNLGVVDEWARLAGLAYALGNVRVKPPLSSGAYVGLGVQATDVLVMDVATRQQEGARRPASIVKMPVSSFSSESPAARRAAAALPATPSGTLPVFVF